MGKLSDATGRGPKNGGDPEPANEVSIQSKVCEVIHHRQQVETAQGSVNW